MGKKENPEGVYQLHLDETVPELVYRFDRNTTIYPLHSGSVILQSSVFAIKTERKRWGLKIFISQSPVAVFSKGHTWTMHEKSEFTAYSMKAHKVKI